jgi:hypothetical protein
MYGEKMYKEWLLETPLELNVVLDIGCNYGDFINLLSEKK